MTNVRHFLPFTSAIAGGMARVRSGLSVVWRVGMGEGVIPFASHRGIAP